MSEIFLVGITTQDLKELVKAAISENQILKAEKAPAKSNEIYLNRFEVKDLLKISLGTLNQWTKKGFIKAYRMGNRVFYNQSEVIASLREVKTLKYRREAYHGA